ncbi:aldehyde dehydrogenase family protein [Jatrophihabitans sp.]|uniref:aldehyde dehydrogenase family protein n=1 Tax=Jatrophihabitans sp. TaxID=1932789 RepID=UPI0030C68DEE|nr:Aldehyde dehydrogenase [Jatrophihabitans sp.]
MGEVTRIPMTIGGQAVDAGSALDVVNPATEAVWAAAPAASAGDVDHAFATAAEAQVAWAHDDAARRKALRAIVDVLAQNMPELAALLTAECGKTLHDSELEIQGTAAWFAYFADLEVAWREVIDAGSVTGVRRPLGVVAAITPWNFPLALASWKLAPALRAGNTVVLKPSPYTPMATLRLGQLLADVLPAGVLNVISGGDDVGIEMTLHPGAAKVSFTGSVEAGKAVAAAVAPDLKRLTLELGGNDPAIVLDDADPLATAQGLFNGGFYNNGQVCGAVKRVYVPESLYPAVAGELARIADSKVVGDGTDPASELGPVQNAAQFDRVQRLLNAALADGAKAVAGGQRVGDRGYFLRPTVLTEVHAGQAIVEEEQFGPVLPLVPYTDVADALRQANDTKFGLGASVWGANRGRLEEVALGIEAGTVWFNNHAVNNGPHVPFGGRKWSGIGIENGLEGLNSFTHLQVLYGDLAD